MRKALVVFLLVCSCLAAEYVTNGRIQIQFYSIPANRVSQLRGMIDNAYTHQDLFGNASVDFQTETNEGIISGYLMADFALSNKAALFFSDIASYNWWPGTKGKISWHQCAIDPSNTNGYVPCYNTNAPTYYREMIIDK